MMPCCVTPYFLLLCVRRSISSSRLPLPDIGNQSIPATRNVGAGQHIGRAAGHSTSDDTSRRDTRSHNSEMQSDNATSVEQETSDATWQNETGDGDACHHPLKSGAGGTAMELFVMGFSSWPKSTAKLLGAG
jgi:hypothetical protein